MELFLEILHSALTNSVMITGLVLIMMIMIEMLNIESRGAFFQGIARSRIGSVLVGGLLGMMPGCLGGFATVSLYTHGLLSFGALIAMMIASSGDEAFVMMAAIPSDALWIFVLLFGIAVAVGLLVDLFVKKKDSMQCGASFEVHDHEDGEGKGMKGARSFGWKRIVMFLGISLFLIALVSGFLDHGHEHEHHHLEGGINLLSEEWMNIFFAALSLIVLVMLVLASDHFVDEHIWHHVVMRHLPRIFAWTFAVLIGIGILLNFFDTSSWISENTALMIVLATLIGVIPESGPHMIFVTLYASGVVPLPVLLASCISQDGHASLPLLAESRRSFLRAKLINCAVALIVGFASWLFI